MEIEVGEYIRTESGIIEKIKTFDEQTNIFKDEKGKLQKWLGETVFGEPYCEEIVKHSKNIIDLIQEYDFVNEEEVDKIKIDENGEKYIKTVFNNIFRNKDIKSILTKELFNQNSYKIGE